MAGGGNVLLQTLLTSCRPLLCGQVAALRPAVPLLRLLQGELGAGGARSLPEGGPGAGGEEAAPAPSHAPPVAEPPSSWTPGTTRAALKRVGEAESGAGVDDGGVGGVAAVLGDTRGQEATLEHSWFNKIWVLKCVMRRLPSRT